MSSTRPEDKTDQDQDEEKNYTPSPSMLKPATLFYEKPNFIKTPPPTPFVEEKKSKTCLIL